MGLRSGIRKKPIPDPGSRGQKSTGCRIWIRNIGSMHAQWFYLFEVLRHDVDVDRKAHWHEGLDVHVLPAHPVGVLSRHHGHPWKMTIILTSRKKEDCRATTLLAYFQKITFWNGCIKYGLKIGHKLSGTQFLSGKWLKIRCSVQLFSFDNYRFFMLAGFAH